MDIVFLLTNCLLLCGVSALNDNNAKQKQASITTGTFWQFTDVHWDLRYTENGDPNAMCHSNNTSGENHNGYFGNYFCDAPWNLVQSAMVAMEHLQANPDFILWTGDNAPHSRDPNPDFNVIFKTISNLTEELKTRFADVPIIPVLGNHDVYPKDDYPAANGTFYKVFLANSGWNSLLREEARAEFSIGGYFSTRISSQLSVLSLNTNLYIRGNSLGTQSVDPAGQFKWIKSKLDEARTTKQKVIISAHAPPGFWERLGESPFFNETYNDDYVNLLGKFGDVIVAQIYGHEHTDSFRIFNSHEGTESVAYLAPSISPWFPPGKNTGTSINPSLRLYSYNSSDIFDYHQYHLNLTEANNDQVVTSLCTFGPTYNRSECEQQLPNLWTLYYQATVTFSAPSLDVTAMTSFLGQLHTDDTLLQRYYRINSAGVEHPPCNATCRRVFLCAIDHLLIAGFERCVAPARRPPVTTDDCDDVTTEGGDECPQESMGAHVLLAGVVATISLTVILGIMLMIVLARRKKTILLGSTPTEFDWTNRHRGYRPLSGDAD